VYVPQFECVCEPVSTSPWLCDVSVGRKVDNLRLVLAAMCSMRMETQPVQGRKVRILALHGGASNSNIMKFQTAQFRKVLGADDFEWLFPDGPEPWEPGLERLNPRCPDHGGELVFFQERPEFEKRLAKGQPFRSWFDIEAWGDHYRANPESFKRAVEWLHKYIEEKSPIDAVVAFAQAAVVTCMVLEERRVSGSTYPWRLNMLFSGTPPEMGVHQDTISLPTILITSPSDLGYKHLGMLFRILPNTVVLEHQDGFGFPGRPPHAPLIIIY